jgi:hypothetical protein
MLPRIFTGTILSIGCVLLAQTAEVGLGLALEELNTAFAAPIAELAETATVTEPGDCPAPDEAPCGIVALFADELPPDIEAELQCVRISSSSILLEAGTA